MEHRGIYFHLVSLLCCISISLFVLNEACESVKISYGEIGWIRNVFIAALGDTAGSWIVVIMTQYGKITRVHKAFSNRV